MKNLIKRIDKVADTLENQGLIIEAEALDVISNTLEKRAYKTETDPIYKLLGQALTQSEQNNKMKVKGFLQQATPNLQLKNKYYPDIPELKQALESHQKSLDTVEKGDLQSTAQDIQNTMSFLKKAEPAIIKGQIT